MDIHEEDNLAEIYRRNRIEEDEFDRFKKKLSTIFIVSIAVILFASAVVFIYCTMQTIKGYFEKHPNTEWESKNPYIHVSIDENGKATSYMEIDGELVLVGFSGIGHNNITVIYKYNSAQQNSSNAKDNGYLQGDTKFRSDRIILEIYRDYIFNGKYPEIVLYRVE